MNCLEVKERLVDYLYEELGTKERHELEGHLGGCPGCRSEVTTLARTLGRARVALHGPLSEEPPARVRTAIMEAARASATGSPVPSAAPPTGTSPQPHRRLDADRPGLWAWLTRPWFLPAFAAVSALALFMIARPALMKPVPRSLPEGDQSSPTQPAPATAPSQLSSAKEEEASRSPEPTAPAESAANEPVAGGLTAADQGAPQAKRQERPALTRSKVPARQRSLPAPAPQGVASVDPPPPERRAVNRRDFAQPPPPVENAMLDGDRSRGEGAVADTVSKTSAPRRTVARQADDEAAESAVAAPEASAPPANLAMGASSGRGQGGGGTSIERKGRVGAVTGAPAAPAPSASAGKSASAAAPPSAAAPAAASLDAPAAAGAPPPAARAAAAPRPPLSLTDLQKRADEALRDGRNAQAAADYRELLRRFPAHREAPRWRRQLDSALDASRR